MSQPRIAIPQEEIEAFCRKWRVREFSLFGSVLRDDFRDDSDVDVLVEFDATAPWSLWDWPYMIDELKAVFGREVDLVEKDALRNEQRRRAILSEHRVLYAA